MVPPSWSRRRTQLTIAATAAILPPRISRSVWCASTSANQRRCSNSTLLFVSQYEDGHIYSAYVLILTNIHFPTLRHLPYPICPILGQLTPSLNRCSLGAHPQIIVQGIDDALPAASNFLPAKTRDSVAARMATVSLLSHPSPTSQSNSMSSFTPAIFPNYLEN